MSKEEKTPYMDDPAKTKKDQKNQRENLIYGNDTAVEEKDRLKKEYRDNKLNENG